MSGTVVAKFTIYAFSLNGVHTNADSMLDDMVADDMIAHGFVEREFECNYEHIEYSALNQRNCTKVEYENAMDECESFSKNARRQRARELAAELSSLVPSFNLVEVEQEIDEEYC